MSMTEKPSLMATIFIGISLLFSASGCGNGKVSSETYEYAMALYSVCNSRDAKRLQAFMNQFDQAKTSGDVAAKEWEILSPIIEEADSGEWESATASVRELLESQVNR